MSVVSDAVNKLEIKLFGSGCDDGVVSFAKSPGAKICPYVRGECITASYGGKNCEIVTSYPLEIKTKISFMYGKSLDSPVKRTAACAILNVLCNFMCFTRVGRACDESSHDDCFKKLKEEINDKKVYLNGTLPGLSEKIADNIVDSPDEAEIIFISGDGLFDEEKLLVTEEYLDKKRLIFTGPATAGVCLMENLEHFCPYGRK